MYFTIQSATSWKLIRRQIDARVVVDIATYLRLASEGDIKSGIQAMGNIKTMDKGDRRKSESSERALCPCEKCHSKRPHPPPRDPWSEYDMILPTLEHGLELPEGYPDKEHRYLICTRRLMGFALKTRTWGTSLLPLTSW